MAFSNRGPKQLAGVGPIVDDSEMADDFLRGLQGVCKDCGNGTLNNGIAEAFDYNGHGVYCLNCGSTHLDLL